MNTPTRNPNPGSNEPTRRDRGPSRRHFPERAPRTECHPEHHGHFGPRDFSYGERSSRERGYGERDFGRHGSDRRGRDRRDSRERDFDRRDFGPREFGPRSFGPRDFSERSSDHRNFGRGRRMRGDFASPDLAPRTTHGPSAHCHHHDEHRAPHREQHRAEARAQHRDERRPTRRAQPCAEPHGHHRAARHEARRAARDSRDFTPEQRDRRTTNLRATQEALNGADRALRKLTNAYQAAVNTPDPTHRDQARAILAAARRDLHTILTPEA